MALGLEPKFPHAMEYSIASFSKELIVSDNPFNHLDSQSDKIIE